MKSILFILMSIIALPVMAQTNNSPRVIKDTRKAKIVVDQGKTKLLLKSGITNNGYYKYSPNIVLELDKKT